MPGMHAFEAGSEGRSSVQRQRLRQRQRQREAQADGHARLAGLFWLTLAVAHAGRGLPQRRCTRMPFGGGDCAAAWTQVTNLDPF